MASVWHTARDVAEVRQAKPRAAEQLESLTCDRVDSRLVPDLACRVADAAADIERAGARFRAAAANHMRCATASPATSGIVIVSSSRSTQYGAVVSPTMT